MCVDRVIEKEGFCMKENFYVLCREVWRGSVFKALLIAGLVVVLLSSFLQGKEWGRYFISLDGY